MNYSENEVSPLYQEDFSKPFMGTIGPANAELDVLTFVHYAISYDEAERQKNIFEMKLRSRRDKDLFDIARLEEIRNKK